MSFGNESLPEPESIGPSPFPTPEQYLQALIDADDRSIDDILAPVRAGFESMSDGDLDDLMARAKNAARAKSGE